MPRQHLFPLSLLLLSAGCLPTTSAYLSVPVETVDGLARDSVALSVPVEELARRMPGLDLNTLAIYGTGRHPIPHQLVDQDDDGAPDAVVVVMPVEADGSTRLVAVCPGPRSTEPPATGTPDDGVKLRFDRASDN